MTRVSTSFNPYTFTLAMMASMSAMRSDSLAARCECVRMSQSQGLLVRTGRRRSG